MANKRDTSKQKRARQNRAQRAAREARSAKANEPSRPSRTAPSRTTSSRGGGSSTSSATSTEEPKGFFARSRAQQGTRPGDVPVDIETLEGGWFTKRVQVPGGRQVLTGALLTIIVTFMTAINTGFRTEPGVEDSPTGSVFDLYGPWAAVPMGLAVVAYLMASQLVISRHRRRMWLVASFAVFAVALSAPPFLIYLLPAGYLLYAVWRARKIEGAGTGRDEGDDEAADADYDA